MRKKFRFLTVLAVCVMVLSCFSVTAFAYADDTEQNDGNRVAPLQPLRLSLTRNPPPLSGQA